jgi:putative membrane protein
MLSVGSPLAAHMAIHIATMNIVAPAIICVFRHYIATSPEVARSPWLGGATGIQLAALWFWHAPMAMVFAMSSVGGFLLMQTSLLLSALWFWHCVSGAARWRSILALLITAKLFCLLGVLLVFAPRAIYPTLQVGMKQHDMPFATAMADQQLAGLLMLIACPLTYLVAGVATTTRWILMADAGSASTNRSNVR